MTSDLAKLMEKISLLQSEPTPEPIIEIEKPTMHPLLQAMQELKEDGIIESVDPHTIFNQVKEIHREFRDIEEGDLPDRIYWFDEYKTSQIPLSQIDLNEFEVDEDLVEDYIEYIKDSPKTMPPIVYDPVAGSVIDGMHRANAYARLGYDSIPAYVGLTKSSSYGEREQDLEEYNIRKTKKFIQRAHDQEQGQMYGDMPYSSHPKQVANLGKKFFGPKFNDEAVKVALLHDVLEDTPYTPEQLAKKGFSKEVIEAVQLLTKNKALSYADNIRNIINSGNPLAMMVKYSDNYMNYSGDKSHWDADRAAHSQKKYLASLNMLGDVLGIKKHVGEEPVDEDIAYHGTTDDITEFHPLSHFGTEKAAKDRMTYKKIKDGKIYKVDLDIKNPLTIKDFPGIHYDRLYAFELRDKKLISQKEMEAITTIDDKAELRKALLTKLNELGIDGFVYKNKYEDKGNISYVIVDPSQVKVLSVEPAAEEVTEASPNTLEGSFTPDLVESKTWLAEMLAKGLKGKNAGTIYVLGSWYGNMGIFLQQAGVKFNKLILIEPNEKWLMHSKELLDTLNDEGKLVLIHQKAEDAVYEKPGVVINTSCNETGPVFLTKLPDNMLCLLQARNNNENTLFPTEHEEDFIDYFPLQKVYYTGKKSLEDPEVNYVRYMMIGRTGKKLDEELHTGGALGLPFPGTYEQEYDKFKSTGQRRITAMTNESEKSFPNIVDTIVKSIPNVNEIYFHGSRAIGKGKRKSDWDILVIVDDSVVGSDYIDTVFALQDIAKEFKNFDIQPSKANNHISRNAKEEGKLLYSADQKIDEALDSSYPYEFKNNAYYFITDARNDYKVTFKGDKKVEVSFMARGENNQPKDDITGTGDSRKVFGTVINIVKDYVGQHQPDILMFAADNNEPSRIRLYNMLASQAGKALPGYNFVKTLKGLMFTTFYLTRDNIKVPKLDTVKNVAGRVLDKVVGE